MKTTRWLSVLPLLVGCQACAGAASSDASAPAQTTLEPTSVSAEPSGSVATPPAAPSLATWKGAAEYVVRWDPAIAGPKTPSEVIGALGLKSGKHEDFEVNYYVIGTPPPTPPGVSSILRARKTVSGKAKFELTYKLRSDQLFAFDTCPLGSASVEDEMDVAFVAAGSVKRVYSRSCDIESKDKAPSPPDALGATLGACPARMGRDEFKSEGAKTKVELWTFADGSTLLEVSRSTVHSDAELTRFEKDVAAPLLEKGVTPIATSKTHAALNCAPTTPKP